MFEFMEEYKYLLSYVNWINFIYLLTIVVYSFYWIGILLKHRIKARNFIEYYFRFLIVLPFWILFIYNVGQVNLEFLYKYVFPVPQKAFTIDNNIGNDTEYYIIRKKSSNGKWAVQYDLNKPMYFPVIDVDVADRKTYYFKDLKGDYSHSALILKTPSDSVFHLIAYKDLYVPGIVFAENIKSKESIRPIMDFSFEFEHIFIVMLATFGIWYYLFLMRRNGSKLFIIIIGSIITLYLVYTLVVFYPTFDYFIFDNPDFEWIHLLNTK